LRIDHSRYLTCLLLILAIFVSIVSMIFLPQIFLRASAKDLNTTSLVEMWTHQNLSLPVLTQWAILFAKAKVARYVITFLLISLLLLAEVRILNRKMAGTLHAVLLVVTWILGILILFAAVLPGMPL
jgi:hypothetical protein